MTTYVDLHRSDFNFPAELQDGEPSLADILWRDNGNYVLWFMGTDLSGNPSPSLLDLFSVSPDWHFKAAANFDVVSLDFGKESILWQNDNGSLALWQWSVTPTVSGVQITLAISAPPNPGPSWHVVGDNDFNGDMADDIFFQNDNGSVAMWTFENAVGSAISGIFAGLLNPGTTWQVVGTGDTDGDGKAGILWQNNNGALVLWENSSFGNGTFTFNTLAPLPTVDPSWHVKGMADFNGDSRSDVAFQNDNGAVVIWEMGGADGTTINDMNLINLNPGPTWHIAGLRDMNGDGKADILLQNDNGAAAVWENYRLHIENPFHPFVTFDTVLPITPNPNPNGHVWDLL